MADALLFEERNFVARVEAIEQLELEAMDGHGVPLLAALEEVDERLFGRLRAEIAAGRHRGKAFWELIGEYCGGGICADAATVDAASVEAASVEAVLEAGPAYDTLDVFVNRVLSFLPMPVPTRELEAEMVDFHKTPASVVLELARRVGPEAVFVDLGAGLGQVVLLVHLLTGARVVGLEIEPAFCGYARACAAELGVTGASAAGGDGSVGALAGGSAEVVFLEGDARDMDYSVGTVFFMYTPFKGELLATVFGLLRQQALLRSYLLVTFGPCSAYAARENWLQVVEPSGGADGLCFFRAG